MFDYVRADVRALAQQEKGSFAKLAVVLLHPGLHSVLLYRLSRWLFLHRMGALSLLVNYVSSIVTGAQISHRAEIGKGLIVYHPRGIVVGGTAVLGDHCTLVHGNVVGQLYGGGDRPVIGERLYAATGAKLLGRIQIGSNVSVGPNAVVTVSLPDGVTVAGNPARIVRRREAAENSTPAAAAGRLEAGNAALVARLAALIQRSIDKAAASALDEHTELLGGGIGLDSLEILRLVNEIEDEFGLTVDESALRPEHLRTVASLASFIEEQMSHGQQPRDLRRAR